MTVRDGTALRIALNVCVRPGLAGGVAPAVGSLVQALGRLADGSEQYTIVVNSQDQVDWLTPLLGPNQRLVRRPTSRKERLLRPVRPAIRLVQHAFTLPRYWPEVPLSDGFVEGLGCDLVHFPTQSYTVCSMRSVYNPIDLQHLHYPEFFSAWDIAWRETVYRAGCQLAQTLIVNSEWIKADVVRQYGVNPAKILVVPEAPPARDSHDTETANADPEQLYDKYRLGGPFILYPAVTWPHKNHLRLFEALAHLRDHRGVRLQLLCTGSRFEPFWPQVEARIRELSLEPQVTFLGHIPADDLRRLYRSTTCLVLPSLFEANSLPVFEAWQAGAPVVCSNATGLPEQVADAALLFDPNDRVAIADALNAVAAPELQETLRARGYLRAKRFSWEKTASQYRAIYRQVAGRNPMELERRRL